MKIRLIHPARINFNAGEVVEASPEQASFLISIGNAERVEETKEAKVPTETREIPEATTKKAVKKAIKK